MSNRAWNVAAVVTASTLIAASLGVVSGCASKSAGGGASARASAASPGAVGTGLAKKDVAELERYLRIRTPGAVTLAPDGTIFVRDWPKGVFQIFRVNGPMATPDAAMTQLTNFQDGAGGYSLSPDGSRMLVLAGVGGNENNNIYAVDHKANDASSVKPITNNPKVQYSLNLWLRDSSGFIYTGNQDSPNDFSIYRYDFEKGSQTGGKSTVLLAKEGSWSAGDISDDGRYLLVERYMSASDSRLFELDTTTGELAELTVRPTDGTANCNWVGYLPGGKAALFTSDHEGGRPQLYMRTLARGAGGKAGEVKPALPGLAQFELDAAAMNPEKTLLVAVTNEDGYAVPHLYYVDGFEKGGFEAAPLPEIEKGVVGITQLRGNNLVYTLNNARTPGVAHHYVVPPKGSKTVAAPNARLVSKPDSRGLDFSGFPLPELVKYKAKDGLEVPAFMYLPQGYTKGTAIPFVVNYHGGPEGQHRPTFSAPIQYLVSRGYGVIQPNVRGSTGYGRAFQMMDDYKNRWDSVRDGVDAAQWLVDNGYATPGRIATYGGSYGGFMAVACVVEDQQRVDAGTQKQRLFGAGVKVVGIVNLKTFLEQTSGYRRKLREVEYGPLTDPEFLESVSPIKKIDSIQVPMMLAHGLNDPRVPVGEAMQLAVGLKQRGYSPVELYFPDEGHGFAKFDNRFLFTRQMVEFLDSTIGAAAQPAKR